MLITRLLPGFRSVVAPFAGLSRLTLRQLLLPVSVATGLWYAMLTWVGAELGDRWEVVVGILDAIYGALGIAAIVVAVALVGAIIWWRRRRRTAP
jgi:membrane protein DedA with SNARE-associated domain